MVFGRSGSAASSLDQSGSDWAEIRQRLRVDSVLADSLKDTAIFTDTYLDRFIKARKNKYDDIKKMLHDHVEWRKTNDVANIESYEFPELEQVKDIYPHGYHGVDKQGRSVYIERLGVLDVHKLLEVTTFDRFCKYFIREYEKLYRYKMGACSRAKGEPVHKTCTILDVKGVGMKHLSGKVREMIGIINHMSANNYPETLGAMYIVNAPVIFSAIWSIVKTFIDPETKKKIHIVNSHNTPKVLLEVVNGDQLPSFLGGLCDCAVERGVAKGCLYSNKGPWMDLPSPMRTINEDEVLLQEMKEAEVEASPLCENPIIDVAERRLPLMKPDDAIPSADSMEASVEVVHVFEEKKRNMLCCFGDKTGPS